MFLGKVDTYCSSDTVHPCNIEKNIETLYFNGIGSPDQVHYVSIKILEIPLLLVFLGEIDKYRCSDNAAICINFYKGPPCNIQKNKIF